MTHVSSLPRCLLQAGTLMHPTAAQAMLICLLHPAGKVSLYSSTAKRWTFATDETKQSLLFSEFFSTGLTGISSARTKSHVRCLQKNFILNTTEKGIWFIPSTLKLLSSTSLTTTLPCKLWCSDVGRMWVNGCLWPPALVLKTGWTSPCYSVFPCGLSLGGGVTETPILWDTYSRACGISWSWAWRKLRDRRKLKTPPSLNAYTKDHSASS